MAGSNRTFHVTGLSLFVLPLAAVKVAALLLTGSGPIQAKASNANTQAGSQIINTSNTVRKIAWTEAQIAAAGHVHMLGMSHFGPTPMLHIERLPQVMLDDREPTEPATTVAEIPAFTLFAVMGTATGDHAVIDGRPYTRGDTVSGTNWMVWEIDVDRGSVVLSEINSNRTTRLNVNRRP